MALIVNVLKDEGGVLVLNIDDRNGERLGTKIYELLMTDSRHYMLPIDDFDGIVFTTFCIPNHYKGNVQSQARQPY